MNRIVLLSVPILTITTLLAACSDADMPAPGGAGNTVPAPLAQPDYYAGITIREIMASLIDPPADAIWNSVRVVSDENGITEYYPETDEEWAALRASAVSIIEGANALMMPGRRVAPPGAEGEFPEYEFTPEEVEALLAADRTAWVGFARNLQDEARQVLMAIDSRDTDGLSEYGAYLDEACEACHSNYWYRAGI